MSVLLAAVMVVALGTWIPLAQLLPGTPDRTRLVYVAVGNVVFAGAALLVAGGSGLSLGWRGFWLPMIGGVVWTAGNYCVFRASATIGLARAAGTWTPINIVCAFVWGALLFGELDGFSVLRFVLLGVAFVAVVLGVLLISGSQATAPEGLATPGGSTARRTRLLSSGLLWAMGAGVLWGSYFIPAQWAATSAQASNFPLALGILVGALALALPAREPVRLAPRALAAQLGAGVIFGVGNLTLLALVSRVGTGTGFTIAQLSLAVNAAIGIWVFHVPRPGTSQARRVLAGIAVAGIGGGVIAAMR
ncbi:GRP family sugar transporter [Microlunatus flavus]|uniref:Glucose uptake protein n=1 Tax=Microlunatus flavus TaxID=1036181 RepID=A0A1H9MIW8_9ACTN|nr:GRP family sugar transporter [Microlunatus flavus]SER23469.1 glucose uptake protein [Microlunatus flavus]